MSLSSNSSFLRRVLVIDAAISGATGLLMVVGAGPLQNLLSVPAPLFRYAGVSLLPFAALLLMLSQRETIDRSTVWTIIALNLAWVVASVVLPFSGAIQPNLFGYLFILGQAAAVAVFAEMQYVGLRRAEA